MLYLFFLFTFETLISRLTPQGTIIPFNMVPFSFYKAANLRDLRLRQGNISELSIVLKPGDSPYNLITRAQHITFQGSQGINTFNPL